MTIDLPEQLVSALMVELSVVGRRLSAAHDKLMILNTVYVPSERERVAGEYEKLLHAVMTELSHLQPRVALTRDGDGYGDVPAKIRALDAFGRQVFAEIVKSLSLDPDDPGLSQRAVLKKAATVTKTTTEEVVKLLPKLSESHVISAGAGQVTGSLAIVALVLWKKIGAPKTEKRND